mmetsp:Transcript_98269/g.262583  ORF Transcript_98269/g.262583 Transcript_98269/m.262583 type:complete len:161 (-) Transcript_98269:133-615(-)
MGQACMGQAGMGQAGMGQAGMGQPGMGQPGMGQPGMGQAGMAQQGVQPGMGQQNMMGAQGTEMYPVRGGIMGQQTMPQMGYGTMPGQVVQPGIHNMGMQGVQGMHQGQMTSQAPTKRVVCRHYQRGNCDRGPNCGFAHGQHEIGDPIPVEVPLSIHNQTR